MHKVRSFTALLRVTRIYNSSLYSGYDTGSTASQIRQYLAPTQVREVNFTYDSALKTLATMSYAGKTWTYVHAAHGGSGHSLLREARAPLRACGGRWCRPFGSRALRHRSGAARHRSGHRWSSADSERVCGLSPMMHIVRHRERSCASRDGDRRRRSRAQITATLLRRQELDRYHASRVGQLLPGQSHEISLAAPAAGDRPLEVRCVRNVLHVAESRGLEALDRVFDSQREQNRPGARALHPLKQALDHGFTLPELAVNGADGRRLGRIYTPRFLHRGECLQGKDEEHTHHDHSDPFHRSAQRRPGYDAMLTHAAVWAASRLGGRPAYVAAGDAMVSANPLGSVTSKAREPHSVSCGSFVSVMPAAFARAAT